MNSFVPAQFSTFTSNFNLDRFKSGPDGSFSSRFKDLRKPTDFLDVSRMSKPSSMSDLQSRISYNLGYFGSNYFLIIAIIALYMIVTNLPLLLLIVFDVASFYLINYFFGESDDLDLRFLVLQKNTLYTIILVINLPVLFIASPFSTLIWLTLISAALVLTHASIMDKPVIAAYSENV